MIDAIKNILFGRYVYQIQLRYKSPDGRTLFTLLAIYDGKRKGDILKVRDVKRLIFGDFLRTAPLETKRNLLCNGTIDYMILANLGKIKITNPLIIKHN